MQSESDALLDRVISIAKIAGEEILPFYRSRHFSLSKKPDGTPVTEADVAAHHLVIDLLSQYSNLPILSEEGEVPDYSVRRQWSQYWIVDPLDGTRGFIDGLDEFSVNIALIAANQPILGVIYAPVSDTVFFAAKNQGAFIQIGTQDPQRIRSSKSLTATLRFIVGKYHKLRRIQPVLDAIPGAQLIRLNSSLKFAAIASGKADVYACFGPIKEWDTAAGQSILEESGGKIVDFDGQNLQYNGGELLSCPPFLAVGDSRHLDTLIALFRDNHFP